MQLYRLTIEFTNDAMQQLSQLTSKPTDQLLHGFELWCDYLPAPRDYLLFDYNDLNDSTICLASIRGFIKARSFNGFHQTQLGSGYIEEFKKEINILISDVALTNAIDNPWLGFGSKVSF